MGARVEKPLLASLDWEALDVRVREQQRNREVHTPAISTFRWWARRSHAMIGEVLDRASEGRDSFCVGDPFSGGGTVAIEAARRGIDVFAQDLHPWAVAGVDAALRPVEVEELKDSAAKFLGRLAELRKSLYVTSCGTHGSDSEVLTAFWVRLASCLGCDRDVYLFPYPLVTRASRSAREEVAWWGCAACGEVSAMKGEGPHRCPACERDLGKPEVPLLPGRQARCPHSCGADTFAPFDQPFRRQLALVQRRCGTGREKHVHFDRPSKAEVRQAEIATESIPEPLAARIPDGLETRVLRNCGFDTWADLYAPRQLKVLAEAIPLVEATSTSAAVRDRLRLAVCGCAEMAGMVSRWDRYYPKAFEAVANHRFSVTGFSCEVNLLAEQGRGTLPRRLGHSVSASEWLKDEVPSSLTVSRRQAGAKGARLKPGGVVLTQGSSERQRAAAGSTDLVLTDPPYFDDVQYAELAAVFLAWARATGLIPSSATLDLSSEAVANSKRGTTAKRYRELLTAIFTETRKTLAANGRMVLTFHNSDYKAWWALGSALKSAGFEIQALAVAHSENERDHAKRAKLAFRSDLVVECRPSSGGDTNAEPEIVWARTGAESKELVAAGRAIAMMPIEETHEEFRERFRSLRGALRPQRITPRERSHPDGQ